MQIAVCGVTRDGGLEAVLRLEPEEDSQASASSDGGTAKSSVISVVPDGREPPTAVTKALRAFQ